MLKELSHFDNLGTPSYFYELLLTLKENQEAGWKIDDVNRIFYNRIIDNRRLFDGCIQLAIKIGILLSADGYIFIDKKLLMSLNSIAQMKDRIVEYLLKAVANDDDFYQIFNSQYLSYDVIYKSPQISINAFGFKYSNFKQLLIDFNVITPHPIPEIKNLMINPRYKKIFDKEVLSLSFVQSKGKSFKRRKNHKI